MCDRQTDRQTETFRQTAGATCGYFQSPFDQSSLPEWRQVKPHHQQRKISQFVKHVFFTARRYVSAIRSVALRLSVTSRYWTKTTKHRSTQTMPHNSPGFRCPRPCWNSNGLNPITGIKHVLLKSITLKFNTSVRCYILDPHTWTWMIFLNVHKYHTWIYHMSHIKLTSSSAVADKPARRTASWLTAKFKNGHVTITTPFCWWCHPLARIDVAYSCTKFDDFRFSRSSDMTGAPKIS